ncbi:hypothetical protein EI71_00782 [Anaeroplasma bactoclasticum]|jgi:hypothetical protein|uniref:Uncharacterized protein n=1 Tax=Anaeroplasma bactoclasticum TaxID=2088 RepID=A0A397RZ17_9MOLU|nr:hypothetical protein [Anaeroplasma bactoclasticum]RIA77806.1 hypothetical protein EI71_00782 [Anaeroplasma bactoclasticum]
MKKSLKFILLAFIALFSISLASCGEHAHNFGALHEKVNPTFLTDGNIAYYECMDCHKYFDANKNEVDTIVLNKYSKEISLSVNYETKADFIVLEEDDNHISWEAKDLNLLRDDGLRIVDKKNNRIVHKFIPDTTSNITERCSIHNDVSNASISLTYTLNGLYLSVSGREELVVQFNYESKLTDMIQSESNENLYELNNVRLKKDSLLNIHFMNGVYFTMGKANSNFRSYMVDDIMYLQCLTDGIYNISFNTYGRDVFIELVEEIPHYTYYFHQYEYSGGNKEMEETQDSNEVVLRNYYLLNNQYYYVLKMNDKDTEDSAPYGVLDSDSLLLGETIDFGVTKMFKVNDNAYYDIYFNTETNEFRLVLIEEE